MRFTNLTFEQILEELNNSDNPYFPKAFLLREMGSLLLEAGEEAKQAEKFLGDMLNSDEPEESKKSVLRYLAALKYMDRETYEKLERFKKKPSNREILKQVKELSI